MKTRIASFNRFEIELPEEAVYDCHHQGACDEDVSYWSGQIDLKVDPDLIRAELKEYGAWDDVELSDDQANKERIIWIAAGNIQEEEFNG